MSYRRVETQTGFHARIIKQCETLSEIYDRRAAAAAYDRATGMLNIPARSAVVFVEE